MNKLEQSVLIRRNFLRGLGTSGLGAAAIGLGLFEPGKLSAMAPIGDTVAQIFTAALVAEDLATTFYYNSLVGHTIEDPGLAGSGGGISSDGTPRITNGNFGNVLYIQAALSEEIAHANLFRSLLGQTDASTDPYQTFYFPAGTFDSIVPFLATLDALENAFIGAYLNAIREFSTLAAQAMADPSSQTYTSQELSYFAVVAASILGVESEHRTLGRVIANVNPSNERNYEQYDGLTSVYTGANSAVAALTPFLTPSTGPGFSLADALANQSSVSYPTTGMPPSVI